MNSPRDSDHGAARLLESLYATYKERGAHATVDSNEIACQLATDVDALEGAFVELRRRDLIAFDVYDEALVNLRLTPRGVEEAERHLAPPRTTRENSSPWIRANGAPRSSRS